MDASIAHPETFDGKIEHLRTILSHYSKVAVAFSGGVDSTVLLDNCRKVFKPMAITALHVRSCLQAARSMRYTEQVMAEHFSGSCVYRTIDCNPLAWPEFVMNTEERCYHCKKRTYRLLMNEASRQGCDVLLDGTNTDDLNEYRPGLKALREYGIVSPFIAASISKADVRRYARDQGLINHDLPSDSCLATRIAPEESITAERMEVVENAEEFLFSLGFAGVRVRPKNSHVCVEVQEDGLPRIVEQGVRRSVVQYFQREGLGPVFLGLKGR